MRTVAAVAILVLGGCFFTAPEPPCSFACSAEGACPDGYKCTDEDNICRRNDIDPSFVCEGEPASGDGDGDAAADAAP